MAFLKFLHDIKNRILQLMARELPGATSLRLVLHRLRGAKIGCGVCIGYDTILETEHPELVTVKDGATIGIRCTLLAHFWEFQKNVTVDEDAFIGPGSIILPGVCVGRGAVVAAGSTVTKSVPPFTMVQGNPAHPIARVGIPPSAGVKFQEFVGSLRPISAKKSDPANREAMVGAQR